MIKGLYETHVFVENIAVSIAKQAMLGLWEKPKQEIHKMHFAFRCDVNDVLYRSVSFLKARNIKPYNFLNDGSETPMVFAWMPAVAIYFEDPDGHELEFIAVLDGVSRPELGVLSFDEWENRKEKY